MKTYIFWDSILIQIGNEFTKTKAYSHNDYLVTQIRTKLITVTLQWLAVQTPFCTVTGAKLLHQAVYSRQGFQQSQRGDIRMFAPTRTFRSAIVLEALFKVVMQIERASWASPSNVGF